MTKDVEDLRRLIEEENPIAFVGAGVSARAKYPPWNRLLDDLAMAATGQPADSLQLVKDDPLWRAEEIRKLFPTDDGYHAALKTIMTSEGRCVDDTLRDLVGLPFRHFMTTNYDDLLERAHRECFEKEPRSIEWRQADSLREFITTVARRARTLPEIAEQRRYLHIHGSLTDCASIVLSDRDYTARYLATDEAQRKLFAIFATQIVVFFGFSLSDPDFMEILRVIRHALGGETGRHYAVLPIGNRAEETSMRRRLAQKFDIHAVFYDYTSDHSGMAEIVSALHGRETPKREEKPVVLRYCEVDFAKAQPVIDRLQRELGVPVEAVTDTRGLDARVVLLCSAEAFEREDFVRDAESALARADRDGAAFLTPIALGDALETRSPLAERLRAYGWSRAESMLAERESDSWSIRTFNAADPNKNQFGSSAERNGRRLLASVTPRGSGDDWFQISLRVEPVTGTVTFHLHPTFAHGTAAVEPVNGVATLELIAWGAFTVGATTDDGRTQLELDLAELESAPKAFRER